MLQSYYMARSTRLEYVLGRIYEKTEASGWQKNLDSLEVVVINLQRAIQAVIDLAAHVVADEQLGAPKTLRENFFLLAQAQKIPADLSERLQRMVGFRNIAVHDYTAVDERIIHNIIDHDLQDLETFAQIVREYARA